MASVSYTIERHTAANGAKHGKILLPNGWRISAVTGPAGCGVHGDIAKRTCEVAIINPLGRMVGDILPHQTPAQLQALVERLSKM